MWIALALVSIVLTAVVLAIWMVPRVRRASGEPRHDVDVLDAGDAADFPAPGESPARRRKDGRPIPGSQEDRRRHGKR
ncbi:MAG: hypothetical protein H0W46_10660 [Acidimicrobiia bacterium]|nr:hypothetical protein [Acidimicrobiia bacterium]